ncbi:MAG: hypothetical protein ACRYGR_03645, partial [Janthinobacterium lividum]
MTSRRGSSALGGAGPALAAGADVGAAPAADGTAREYSAYYRLISKIYFLTNPRKLTLLWKLLQSQSHVS